MDVKLGIPLASLILIHIWVLGPAWTISRSVKYNEDEQFLPANSVYHFVDKISTNHTSFYLTDVYHTTRVLAYTSKTNWNKQNKYVIMMKLNWGG